MIVANRNGLTVNEAAARMGVHPNTVRNMIKEKRIIARRILGKWYVQESEVERVLRGEANIEESQEDK